MSNKDSSRNTEAARAAVLALWNMPAPSRNAKPGTAADKPNRGAKPAEEEVLVADNVIYVDF